MAAQKYTVAKELHIRQYAPRVQHDNLAGVLYEGFIIDAVEEVEGEVYEDPVTHFASNAWLKDGNGFYYWKGGVVGGDTALAPALLPRSTEWWFEFLQIERLWTELGTRGEGVSVAVWDTGFDNRRSTIVNTSRLSGENFLDVQMDKLGDTDPGFHGTEVLRLIGGDGSMPGVAPGCNLIVAKGVDQKNRRYKFKEFIESKSFKQADIVNISYAFLKEQDPDVFNQIVEFVPASDKIIVAAMGNYGKDFEFITAPGSFPSVIGVNAIMNEQMKLADLSTRVPNTHTICLTAPGVGIKSIFFSDQLSGTSYACAVVTGVCALIIAYLKKNNIPFSSGQIKSILESACIASSQWDKQLYGNGVLQSVSLIEKLKQLPL